MKYIIEKDVTINATAPVELKGLTPVLASIDEATTPDQLVRAAKYTADTLEQLKLAKKALADRVKEINAEAKEYEKAISDVEGAIKTKALELVEVETTQKVNVETGEVKYTDKHNLTPKVFSFTPSHTHNVLDKGLLLKRGRSEVRNEANDLAAKLVKEVISYEIDSDKLLKAIANPETRKLLPYMETTTDLKISIQKAFLTRPSEQTNIAEIIGNAALLEAK